MKLRVPQIKIYSGRMLEFLDANQLEILTDLDNYMNTSFGMVLSEGRIVFGAHLSNSANLVRTMSYEVLGLGIPLEVAINDVENYIRYIVKSCDALTGYAPFAVDPFDNQVSCKKIKGSSLDLAREELLRLRDLP